VPGDQHRGNGGEAVVTGRQKAREQRKHALWQERRRALVAARTAEEKFTARLALFRIAANRLPAAGRDDLLNRADEMLRQLAPVTDRDFTSGELNSRFHTGSGGVSAADVPARPSARGTA
jgi:hypothetical protein